MKEDRVGFSETDLFEEIRKALGFPSVHVMAQHYELTPNIFSYLKRREGFLPKPQTQAKLDRLLEDLKKKDEKLYQDFKQYLQQKADKGYRNMLEKILAWKRGLFERIEPPAWREVLKELAQTLGKDDPLGVASALGINYRTWYRFLYKQPLLPIAWVRLIEALIDKNPALLKKILHLYIQRGEDKNSGGIAPEE